MVVCATRTALLGFFVCARATLLQASKSTDADIHFVFFIVVLSSRPDYAYQRPLKRLQLKVHFKTSGILFNVYQFEVGIGMQRY
jgi:hypothetical protein